MIKIDFDKINLVCSDCSNEVDCELTENDSGYINFCIEPCKCILPEEENE